MKFVKAVSWAKKGVGRNLEHVRGFTSLHFQNRLEMRVATIAHDD